MRSKMKKEIDPDIIAATTKCPREFQCLEPKGKPCCNVENFVMKNVLYIKCPSDEACDYILPQCACNICLCRTRKDLYRKYGI